METDRKFANLMQRVLAGCKESAVALHEEYGPHILRAVRRRLHDKLRPKFDSCDFVQDVWASFFTQLPKRMNFGAPEDLVAFLSRMASNKVAEEHRNRLLRQKRNINRETPLDVGTVNPIDKYQATPSEEMMGKEAWDQLLEKLPVVHRRVVILLREGKSPTRISQDLDISVKTVYRIIRRAFPENQP